MSAAQISVPVAGVGVLDDELFVGGVFELGDLTGVHQLASKPVLGDGIHGGVQLGQWLPGHGNRVGVGLV
ncbi:hypothetical protein [Streptomyces sp. NPDC058745]|uniref:hypothetical protein n=1 Tax=Streptomyces sp. NPDC058745 TaxID=3346621 RepID=UPI0036A8CD54